MSTTKSLLALAIIYGCIAWEGVRVMLTALGGKSLAQQLADVQEDV